jgi:transposase-like protein
MPRLSSEQLVEIQAYYENPEVCPKPKEVCQKFGINDTQLRYHAKRRNWFPAYKSRQKSDKLLKKGMAEVIEQEAMEIANAELERCREIAVKASVEGLDRFQKSSPTPKDFNEANRAYDLIERAMGIKEDSGIKLGVDINFLSTPQPVTVDV